MREIKFRGKRTDTGEWVYGDLLHVDDLCCIGRTIEAFTESPFNECLVNPDTVGQYTGLKDKNGKDIYDGDVLGTEGKIVGWVKGDVRGYCYDVVYVNHPAGEKRWTLYSTVVDDYPNKIEVIGNIHDNTEFLEEGK